MPGHRSLAEGQATVIGGHLPVQINREASLLKQGMMHMKRTRM